MDEAIRQVRDLYREHGPALLRYLRRSFGGVASPEDLLQETFVRVLSRAERLAEAVSQRAWLFAVARNVAISALRRKRAHVALPRELPAPAGPPADDRLDRVRRAVAALPAAQREALELRLREQLRYDEIAAVLGVPVGTVRSRLHQALRRLRDGLAEGRA